MVATVFSHVATYAHALAWNWGGLFWLVTLVPDALPWVLSEDHMTTVENTVRRLVVFETVLALSRFAFVGFLFFAGLFAWEEQYEEAQELPAVIEREGDLKAANAQLAAENRSLGIEKGILEKERIEEHDKGEQYAYRQLNRWEG
jgi:hypothetical protein